MEKPKEIFLMKSQNCLSLVSGITIHGFPGGASSNESACQWRTQKRLGFSPWIGKIFWRREWHPTPVSLPGKSHGQRCWAGYSLWGHRVGCNSAPHTAHMTNHTGFHHWYWYTLFSISFFLSFIFYFLKKLLIFHCGIAENNVIVSGRQQRLRQTYTVSFLPHDSL